MAHFFCCSTKEPKKKNLMQETREKIEKSTSRKLRFTNEQLYEFTQRFESQATLHRMNLKQYRDSLGLIGMQSLSFLADRMFLVMDRDNKGYISLDEYLCYIDIMMYGSEDEKLVQSFQLLDLRQKGEITFEDFNKIVHSFAKMWSAAIGTPSKLLSLFRSYANLSLIKLLLTCDCAQLRSILSMCAIFSMR